MNRKSLENSPSPWLAGALPALLRARKRAEETARRTRTALIVAKNGKPVRIRPNPSARGKTS